MKMAQVQADGVFLRAFDATIQEVHQQLTSSGLNDAAIWAAFRRATSVLAEISVDVDTELSSRMTLSKAS